MDNPKSQYDLESSLAVIQSNVQAYLSGNKYAYLPVAVQLRKLLCDTQAGADNSLIPRLFSNFRLRPLLGNQNRVDEYTVLYIPGQMKFDGRGGSKLYELFDESASSLSLAHWLDQKLFDFSMTIRGFIRSVADKEAAHSDKSYNAILRKTKSVLLSNDTLAAKTIIKMGCFVVKSLAIRKLNDNIDEIGAYVLSEFNKNGRGVAVLNLSDFASHFLNGIPIIYKPASTAKAYFQHDPQNCTAAMKILQTYQPSIHFILLVIDLNSELWLCQQAMKSRT